MRLRSPLRLAALCGALLPLWANAVPVVQVPGYQVELFASGVGSPSGMALSPGGDLYLTDYAGGQLLRISSPFASTGNPFDVVSTGISFPTDVAFAFVGRLFVSSSTGPTSQILEVLGGGTTQVFASGFSFPTSLASFGGFLYVANSGYGTVSKIDSGGNVSGFLSGFSAPDGPVGLSFDPAGNLYLANHETGAVFVVDSGGNAQEIGMVSPFSSGATTPTGQGVFVNDVVLGSLALIDTGLTSTFATGFAGKDNPPFNGPGEVVLLDAGTLLVADAQSVWRISAVPEPGTVALLFGALLGAVLLRRRATPSVLVASVALFWADALPVDQ